MIDTTKARELLGKATPGEWGIDTNDWDGTEFWSICKGADAVAQEPTEFFAYPSCSFISADGHRADADLIVYLRNNAAAMLDEIDSAREVLEFYADTREHDAGNGECLPGMMTTTTGGNCCDGVYGHEDPKTPEENKAWGGPKWIDDNGTKARAHIARFGGGA